MLRLSVSILAQQIQIQIQIQKQIQILFTIEIGTHKYKVFFQSNNMLRLSVSIHKNKPFIKKQEKYVNWNIKQFLTQRKIFYPQILTSQNL